MVRWVWRLLGLERLLRAEVDRYFANQSYDVEASYQGEHGYWVDTAYVSELLAANNQLLVDAISRQR